MNAIKRILAGLGLIGWLWLTAGCTEVVVPGTLTGAGEYYRYTTDNTARKTFVATPGEITAASREALKKMDIKLYEVHSVDGETELTAATTELDIRIGLEPITATTTKVTVNAVQDHVIKDKATADELLAQIQKELERRRTAKNDFPRIFIENACHRPIDVIVYCLAAKDEPRTWQTRGWFYLDAGQKKYVANGHNRYIYFYGQTQPAGKLVWDGDVYQWFEGRRYGFFKVDTGTEMVDFTQTFSCD